MYNCCKVYDNNTRCLLGSLTITINFARIIHTLPTEIKNIYRKIEKNENKLLKNKWSLIFNETCLNEEILPNYTIIYKYKNCYF